MIANEGKIDSLTERVAVSLATKTDEGKMAIIELEKRWKESAEFLDTATQGISDSWLKWLKESSSYLKEVREWKIAIERENRHGVQSCKDALDFMGASETAEKLKTLRELVELCERLKALKESGFLDSFVDVLVKVKP